MVMVLHLQSLKLWRKYMISDSKHYHSYQLETIGGNPLWKTIEQISIGENFK